MAATSYIQLVSAKLNEIKALLLRLVNTESRRQVLVSTSWMAMSGMIGLALQFLGSMIQARFIGPETLGYYNKFTILPGYLFFLQFGVYTTLAGQYPYFIGKGDTETALSYAANALGWTYFLCVVHTVFFLVPCVWAALQGDWPAALGWGTQIILTSTSVYMTYLGCTYRNSTEFVAWSKIKVISSVTSLFLLPLVAAYHFFGLCIRYAVPEFVSILYAHWKRPLKILSKFELGVLKKMIVFGAPMMGFHYILTIFWDTILRSYIFKMTDEKTLGVFVFSGTLCAGLLTISTSMSQVFHPRIAMLYGSSGKNMAVSFRFCLRCSLSALAIMLPIVGLTFWLIDPLVRLLFPKYIECIPITRCLCWLTLIPVIDFPKHLLIVAKHTKAYGISVVVGFTLFLSFLALLTFSSSEVNLQKIVIVSVVCKLISTFLGNAFSWREAKLAL